MGVSQLDSQFDSRLTHYILAAIGLSLTLYLAGLLVSHHTLVRCFGGPAAFWSVALLAHATPLAWHAATGAAAPLAAFGLSAIALALALDQRQDLLRSSLLGGLVGALVRLAGPAAWALRDRWSQGSAACFPPP